MENFYKQMGVIIGFLSITFLIQTFAGDNVASKMVLFVLFSVVILNANNLKNVLDGAFKSKE